MCAGRGGKGKGHNLRHVTCVIFSPFTSSVLSEVTYEDVFKLQML